MTQEVGERGVVPPLEEKPVQVERRFLGEDEVVALNVLASHSPGTLRAVAKVLLGFESDDEMATWARQVTGIDEKVRAILQEGKQEANTIREIRKEERSLPDGSLEGKEALLEEKQQEVMRIERAIKAIQDLPDDVKSRLEEGLSGLQSELAAIQDEIGQLEGDIVRLRRFNEELKPQQEEAQRRLEALCQEVDNYLREFLQEAKGRLVRGEDGQELKLEVAAVLVDLEGLTVKVRQELKKLQQQAEKGEEKGGPQEMKREKKNEVQPTPEEQKMEERLLEAFSVLLSDQEVVRALVALSGQVRVEEAFLSFMPPELRIRRSLAKGYAKRTVGRVGGQLWVVWGESTREAVSRLGEPAKRQIWETDIGKVLILDKQGEDWPSSSKVVTPLALLESVKPRHLGEAMRILGSDERVIERLKGLLPGLLKNGTFSDPKEALETAKRFYKLSPDDWRQVVVAGSVAGMYDPPSGFGDIEAKVKMKGGIRSRSDLAVLLRYWLTDAKGVNFLPPIGATAAGRLSNMQTHFLRLLMLMGGLPEKDRDLVVAIPEPVGFPTDHSLARVLYRWLHMLGNKGGVVSIPDWGRRAFNRATGENLGKKDVVKEDLSFAGQIRRITDQYMERMGVPYEIIRFMREGLGLPVVPVKEVEWFYNLLKDGVKDNWKLGEVSWFPRYRKGETWYIDPFPKSLTPGDLMFGVIRVCGIGRLSDSGRMVQRLVEGLWNPTAYSLQRSSQQQIENVAKVIDRVFPNEVEGDGGLPSVREAFDDWTRGIIERHIIGTSMLGKCRTLADVPLIQQALEKIKPPARRAVLREFLSHCFISHAALLEAKKQGQNGVFWGLTVDRVATVILDRMRRVASEAMEFNRMVAELADRIEWKEDWILPLSLVDMGYKEKELFPYPVTEVNKVLEVVVDEGGIIIYAPHGVGKSVFVNTLAAFIQAYINVRKIAKELGEAKKIIVDFSELPAVGRFDSFEVRPIGSKRELIELVRKGSEVGKQYLLIIDEANLILTEQEWNEYVGKLIEQGHRVIAVWQDRRRVEKNIRAGRGGEDVRTGGLPVISLYREEATIGERIKWGIRGKVVPTLPISRIEDLPRRNLGSTVEAVLRFLMVDPTKKKHIIDKFVEIEF